MSQHNTYYTSSSSVTGARLPTTTVVSVSGRPSVTYVTGEKIGTFVGAPRVVVGFDAILNIQGYNFNKGPGRTTTVYVSTTPGVYTNHLSGAVAEYDFFSTYPYLSSTFPAFSGFQITEYVSLSGEKESDPERMAFRVISANTLAITLCGAQASGGLEVIIVNKAGYSTLAGDTSGRIVTVSS
jgi:hypothetical protein